MPAENSERDGVGNEPLRIVYVTMRYPLPSESFATVEVASLLRAGQSVCVACLREPHPEHQRLVRERGLDASRISFNSLRASLRGLGFALLHPGVLLFLLGRIIRYDLRSPRSMLIALSLMPRVLDIFASLRRDPPDVVHVFWGHYPSLVTLLVQKYLPDVGVSLFLGSYDLERVYGSSREVARVADVVWTHAAANIPDILAFGGVKPERIEVSYRGIEIREGGNGISDKSSQQLISIERLIPEKHTRDAIEVFAQVRQAIPDARLVICGDGPERAELEMQVRQKGLGDAVSFRGFVAHEQVFRETAASEILLSMSQLSAERLPNAVKEAMSQYCVPVVTETMGIEELVVDGECGFIVAPGDIAAAAGHVIALLSDSRQRERMARQGRQRMEAVFDVDVLAKQRIAVWQRILGRG